MDEQKEKYQPKRAKAPKSRLGKRGKLIAAAVVLILLIGGYAALCAAVDTERVLPKTTVNGVDLSGMTQQEAAAELEKDFENRYGQAQLTVTANGEEYIVQVGDTLGLDEEALASQALERSQKPFLTRGVWLMKAALTGSEAEVLPTVSDAEALHENIEDSGLLEINTTVQTSYEVKDGQLIFTMGKTGNSVDEAGLSEKVNAAVQAGDYESVIECPMITGEVKAVNLDKIYKKIHKKAVNATLDPENGYAVVESVTGVSFDKEKTQEALDQAKEGSEVKIDLKYKEPEITTQKLKDNLFKDKLGSYTTKVSGTANRLSNVRLAAEKCNGTIMLNGDVFSYNECLGERTAANGFKTAGAYLNGETVQEYGGGICQVSSTLYSATLYANLKIVQRQNHTYASSYIGLGMDATVSWGGPDFQFSNDKSYPIKIEASYYDGYLTVTIWGTKTDDTSVEIVSETLETIPFETEYKEDSSKYVGESYVSQKGEDGYKVQTYRKVYDGDGNLISNEKEAYSVYSKHNQIIYQGTKEKPKPKPKTETTTDGAAATSGNNKGSNQTNNTNNQSDNSEEN